MALLHIITDLGSTFVNSNQPIYKRHRDGYNQITAAYTNEGDKVFYDWEWLSASLEKVDAAFEVRIDKYRNAKSVLFEKNENGVYIPRLRTNIIRGIENAPDTLEDKILMANRVNFTPAEYRAMADIVHEIITEYAARNGIKVPVWETALSWVQGNVIAPANFRFFEALTIINNYFQEIHRSFEQGGGFKEAYEYYVEKRRGIMAYQARRKDSQQIKQIGVGAINKERGEPNGTLAEEIKVLLEEFGDEIRTEYRDATILSVKRVRKKNEVHVKVKRATEPHLFRGIYTDKQLPEGKKVVTIDGIDLSSKLADISILKQPDFYITRLKEICIEYGFPIKMMRDYVLGVHGGKKGEDEAKAMAISFMNDHGIGSYEAIKLQMRKTVEEAGGVPYDKLKPMEREMLDIVIARESMDLIKQFQNRLYEKKEELRKLKSRIKSELK